MKIERDERKFDFHGIGLAIKKAREREGMTQEQLGYIVDRDPRTIMYHENDGQHPSLSCCLCFVCAGAVLCAFFSSALSCKTSLIGCFLGGSLLSSVPGVAFRTQ